MAHREQRLVRAWYITYRQWYFIEGACEVMYSSDGLRRYRDW